MEGWFFFSHSWVSRTLFWLLIFFFLCFLCVCGRVLVSLWMKSHLILFFSLKEGLTWFGLITNVWLLVFQKLYWHLIKETKCVTFLSKRSYISVFFISLSFYASLLFLKWLILCCTYYKGEQLLGELRVKKRRH